MNSLSIDRFKGQISKNSRGLIHFYSIFFKDTLSGFVWSQLMFLLMEKTLCLIILFKWSLDTAETTSNFHETLVCVQTIYGFLNDSDFNVIPMALAFFSLF